MARHTLRNMLLVITPPHTVAVDSIALLCLVTKTVGFIGSRRAGCAVVLCTRIHKSAGRFVIIQVYAGIKMI